jgi:hypothetical protein
MKLKSKQLLRLLRLKAEGNVNIEIKNEIVGGWHGQTRLPVRVRTQTGLSVRNCSNRRRPATNVPWALSIEMI